MRGGGGKKMCVGGQECVLTPGVHVCIETRHCVIERRSATSEAPLAYPNHATALLLVETEMNAWALQKQPSVNLSLVRPF
jgi:hypothetical protein